MRPMIVSSLLVTMLGSPTAGCVLEEEGADGEAVAETDEVYDEVYDDLGEDVDPDAVTEIALEGGEPGETAELFASTPETIAIRFCRGFHNPPRTLDAVIRNVHRPSKDRLYDRGDAGRYCTPFAKGRSGTVWMMSFYRLKVFLTPTPQYGVVEVLRSGSFRCDTKSCRRITGT